MVTGGFPTPTAHPEVHPPDLQNATSPPSKRDLTSWWKAFQKRTKKEGEKANDVEQPTGIFGVPLQVSIKYANVAISLSNEKGESFIYGYVPIVVAKCGVFLKEKATDVEGIFRLSGSAKRIKELQATFDSPDRYGKGLDWTGYTVHDAANILRRYLNLLPQPIVPLDFYERCRDPLRSHQAQAVGDRESQGQGVGDFDANAAIITYQRLITELPPLNRQLLLYILDLLAVFASKSDLNRMNSANLAAIFQPGILSHPSHDMSPNEYRLSQDVLMFLIENQDSFLIGMNGTAADEKTVKDVQSGIPPRRKSQSPSAPRIPQTALGRSSSNASAGADSLRKFGGVRRNVSVSSKNSKASANVPSPISSIPGSPLTGSNGGMGVQRSNTLPSKKSPGITSSRFSRPTDTSPSTSAIPLPTNYLAPMARASSPGSKLAQTASEGRSPSTNSSLTPTVENNSALSTVEESIHNNSSKERLLHSKFPHGPLTQIPTGAPTRERKVSTLFSKSPVNESEMKDVRQPNKLRKKRLPESSNASAQSSTQSLTAGPDSPANQSFYTPMPTPGTNDQSHEDLLASVPPILSNTAATPLSEIPPQTGDDAQEAKAISAKDVQHPNTSSTLQPSKSPTPSFHSRTSVTDLSETSHTDDAAAEIGQGKKKRRWRISSSATRNDESRTTLSASSQIGNNTIAEHSSTSIGSSSKARRSTTRDSQQPSVNLSASSHVQTSGHEFISPKDNEAAKGREISQEAPEKDNSEKKGPIGWLKAKVAQAKEERKEREAEKGRAKSPPGNDNARTESKQSLSAIAQEAPPRGRSIDARPGPDHSETRPVIGSPGEG